MSNPANPTPPTPTAPTPTLLTGTALQKYLHDENDEIRVAAGIRSRSSYQTSSDELSAIRTLGSGFAAAAKVAVSFVANAQDTGIFVGLPFTQAEFVAALADQGDKQSANAVLGALAQDAHGENTDAKGKAALMIIQIDQVRQGILSNPGVDPKIKAKVTATGAELATEMAKIKASRKASGSKTKASHAALDSSEANAAEVTTDLHGQVAQLDVENQYLRGEAIRPEDVAGVVAASKGTGAAGATAGGATKAKGRIGKATATGAAAPTPKKQIRRKTTRG